MLSYKIFVFFSTNVHWIEERKEQTCEGNSIALLTNETKKRKQVFLLLNNENLN